MDYFDSLSPDITSRILSFTNTPTISRCCRVSRNSLQIIQSNPNLHQEVDLFKLNRKQDLPLILFNLTKYSYLSRNTIKHVSIHTDFMKQERSPKEPVFRDAFEIFDSRSSSSLDHNPSLSDYSFEGIPLVVQALSPSRATLQYLSFQIPDSHQFNVQRINHLIPYLDQHLPNLKGLFFYVPDALEDIQCGSDHSRTVVIKNNFSPSKTRMTQYDEQDLIKLLQTMRIFCRGQDLTRFCIDGGENKMSSYECLNPLEVLIEPVSTEMIDELTKSRFSLRSLDLGSIYSYHPHHALELILSCPNLESLNLGFAQRYYYYDVNRAWRERQAAIEDGEFDSEYDSQDDASDSDVESDLEADISDSGLVINVVEARYKKPLRFPSNLPFTSQLKHLNLTLDGRSFQVDHLAIKWIGSDLETLRVQEKHKSPSPAIERKQLFNLIKSSQSTLKSIRLERLWERSETIEERRGRKKKERIDGLQLSNLEDLVVSQSPAFSLDLIDGSKCFKLKTIRYECTEKNPFVERKSKDEQASLSSLLSIFKSARSTLESVDINGMGFKVGVNCRRQAIAMEGYRILNLKTLNLRNLYPIEVTRRITGLRYPSLEDCSFDTFFHTGVNSFSFPHFAHFIKKHRKSLRRLSLQGGGRGARERLGGYETLGDYSNTFKNIEKIHIGRVPSKVWKFLLEFRYPNLVKRTKSKSLKSFKQATKGGGRLQSEEQRLFMRMGGLDESESESESDSDAEDDKTEMELSLIMYDRPFLYHLMRAAERFEGW